MGADAVRDRRRSPALSQNIIRLQFVISHPEGSIQMDCRKKVESGEQKMQSVRTALEIRTKTIRS